MPPPEIVRLALLVLHFVGLAALIGPFLLQIHRERPRLHLMFGGVITQIITGNALIATRQVQGLGVDEIKMIVKLGLGVIALAALIAAVLMRRRVQADVPPGSAAFRIAGTAGLTAVAVAVVWT